MAISTYVFTSLCPVSRCIHRFFDASVNQSVSSSVIVLSVHRSVRRSDPGSVGLSVSVCLSLSLWLCLLVCHWKNFLSSFNGKQADATLLIKDRVSNGTYSCNLMLFKMVIGLKTGKTSNIWVAISPALPNSLLQPPPWCQTNCPTESQPPPCCQPNCPIDACFIAPTAMSLRSEFAT